MAALPTGVTIVTAAGEAGPAGATANAVCSLSLDPPLMLACLDRGSRTLDVVARRTAASGSACSPPTRSRSRARSRARPRTRRSSRGSTSPSTPRFRSSRPLAWVVCALRELHDGGDHLIMVGDVLDLGVDVGDPLVFFGGGYRALD